MSNVMLPLSSHINRLCPVILDLLIAHSPTNMWPALVPQLVLLICLSSAFLAAPVIEANAPQYSTSSPSLFVFGASMVDSGTNAVAMPFRSHAEFEPYGSDYFGEPVGRWSNGRTFMDIISQSLGLGLLSPFIQSVGSNFSSGVNFASSGSTAQNTSDSSITDSGGLFSLLVQVEQFRAYQKRVLSTQQDLRKRSSIRMQFANSIYFFETAHNDYLHAGIDCDHLKVVKLVMDSMRQAFEVLYTLGARNFIVMNVTPLGCTPAILMVTTALEKDDYNCTRAWNEWIGLHNENLAELLQELQSTYPLANWTLFDAYSIFLDGYQNPTKYEIQYPFEACCGVSGDPYNYNKEVACGGSTKYINGTYVKANKCEDPSLHLIWDTFHPVESFCKHIAQGVLTGSHLIPYFNITMRFQEESPIVDDLKNFERSEHWKY